MVSARLIHQVEDHWEAISGRFLRLLRATHGLPHISQLPESEITEVCRRLLRNLGQYLVSAQDEDELALHYEKLGRDRYHNGVPLSQALRTVQLMKDATLDYIRDEMVVQTGVDLYAEEELEHRLGRFFDLLVYHLARGYEEACAHK